MGYNPPPPPPQCYPRHHRTACLYCGKPSSLAPGIPCAHCGAPLVRPLVQCRKTIIGYIAALLGQLTYGLLEK